MKRSARLEVDLDLVAQNLRTVRGILDQGPVAADGAPPRVAAVVKGNAYGLGAVAVAGELLAQGVDLLAVACLPEALELKRVYPDAPILVMGHTPTDYLGDAARAGLRTTLFDLPQAEALSRAAQGAPALVHVKIDTGMNRIGIKPDAGTPGLLARMAALPGLRLEGIFTHLALRDRASDLAQFALFSRVLDQARAAGLQFPLRHVCDSIGMMRYPEFRLDLVRPGAILFGVKPLRTPLSDSTEVATPFALRARISRVARIGPGEGAGYDEDWRAPAGGAVLATVPVGYADGYSRSLSNRAEAIVAGRRVPVRGLVMMDQLTLDVTAAPEVRAGDEVLLLGRSGADEVGVLELAGWAGTNRNEILSSIGRRVPRVYRRGGRDVAEADYLLDPGGPCSGMC